MRFVIEQKRIISGASVVRYICHFLRLQTPIRQLQKEAGILHAESSSTSRAYGAPWMNTISDRYMFVWGCSFQCIVNGQMIRRHKFENQLINGIKKINNFSMRSKQLAFQSYQYIPHQRTRGKKCGLLSKRKEYLMFKGLQ